MKRISILILAAMIIILACISEEKNTTNRAPICNKKAVIVDIDSLNIDQELTYISLSKNDSSGYNRWLPFYFVVQGNENCTERELEEELSQRIKKINLLSENNKIIFSTSELIWSAYKLPGGVFNLSLVLIPKCGELGNIGLINVNSLELVINDNRTLLYSLEKYEIEERETLYDDHAYISVSTIDTSYTENLTALVDYGIYVENGMKIESVEIDYPMNFSDIEKYEILEVESAHEKEFILTVSYHFSSLNPRTMFRPFLRVVYENGESGWLVPPLPVFIN